MIYHSFIQETPFEAMQRRMAEKKKAKKLAKKQAKVHSNAGMSSQGEHSENNSGNLSAANTAELELLLSVDDNEMQSKSFDMRALVKAEKDRSSGRKMSKKG
jgi:hypothetical protein